MVRSWESFTETFPMFQIMFTHYDYSVSQFHHNSFKIRQRCKSCSCFQRDRKLRFEFGHWHSVVQLDLVEDCWFGRGCSDHLLHELDFASAAGFQYSDWFQVIVSHFLASAGCQVLVFLFPQSTAWTFFPCLGSYSCSPWAPPESESMFRDFASYLTSPAKRPWSLGTLWISSAHYSCCAQSRAPPADWSVKIRKFDT